MFSATVARDKWNSYVYIHLVVSWERISYYSYFIFNKVASNSYSTEQYGWKKIPEECCHIKKKLENLKNIATIKEKVTV